MSGVVVLSGVEDGSPSSSGWRERVAGLSGRSGWLSLGARHGCGLVVRAVGLVLTEIT